MALDSEDLFQLSMVALSVLLYFIQIRFEPPEKRRKITRQVVLALTILLILISLTIYMKQGHPRKADPHPYTTGSP